VRLTPTDLLDLGDGHGLAVVSHDAGWSAIPVLPDHDQWRRATIGDGVAEALIRLLAATPGRSSHGRFTVISWAGRHQVSGERSIGVDQTNESVIVGNTAVVKWATHLEPGPHPAPSRLSTLTAAGFTAMPAPWGLVTWRPDGGDETLAATVTGYLPGAVDGWTWAVDLFAAGAAADDACAVVAACTRVGEVIADLHASLSTTVTTSTQDDARRWRDAALETLTEARTFARPTSAQLLGERDDDIARVFGTLGDLVGIPIFDAHGDLHVGQVLRSDDGFVVTDFDGNPVLAPTQRVLPVPAALDLSGMLQSLAHVAIVAAKHHDLDPAALGRISAAAQSAFFDAYVARLADVGHGRLFVADALVPFRLQQVLREIVYAGRHLARWMYVPDAALPALLEGIRP
jgi:maltokinase